MPGEYNYTVYNEKKRQMDEANAKYQESHDKAIEREKAENDKKEK